jgi:hypothetical protein
MSVAVSFVEAVPTQVLGPYNDDGERFYQQAFDIIAHPSNGGPMYVHPVHWMTKESAEWFVNRVKAVGRINPEHWWECTPSELPDYVTEWWRPEFN